MAATIKLVRTVTQLLDWNTLNDTGSATPYLESGQADISSQISCLFHIDMAQENTTAISDTAFCKVWGKSGSTDEDWHEIAKLTYGTVASTQIDVSGGADAADVSMACDTTKWSATMLGSKVFVHNVGTEANSFIATVVDFTTTVNELWLMDGAGTDTTTADKIYCLTVSPFSAVAQWNVRIPEEMWAAKASFHNPDADANYACRVRYTMITDYTSV